LYCKPCGTGAVDGGYERSQNFKKVLESIFAGNPPEVLGSVISSNLQGPTQPSPSIPTSSLPSPHTQTTGDRWYPDYNPIWAKGICINSYPAPSGRPHYDSQSECCAKAYGGQVSGACVSLLPLSPVESPSTPSSFIPDASAIVSVVTRPTKKPVGASSIEEVKLPNTEVGEAGVKWYPDYNPIWALGVCSNKAPLAHGRPTYSSQTQTECCEFAYRGQASGACVNHVSRSRDTPNKPVSSAESFTTEFMAPHAVLRSNFITYSCGESNTIPYNTAIMDIFYYYEVLLPQTVQVKHALPSLKKEIMDGLADTLNCQMSDYRRGLRKVLDGTLFGFQSVEGSDVIDEEKGSCTVTQEKDGEMCYPVIGHIAAVMKIDSTNDEVLGVKNDILDNIRHTMAGNSISSGIEHINAMSMKAMIPLALEKLMILEPVTTDSSNRAWVAVVCCFLVIAVVVTLTLLVMKRRRVSRMVSKSGTHDIDSSDEMICVEKEFGIEETFCINSSLYLYDESRIKPW